MQTQLGCVFHTSGGDPGRDPHKWEKRENAWGEPGSPATGWAPRPFVTTPSIVPQWTWLCFSMKQTSWLLLLKMEQMCDQALVLKVKIKVLYSNCKTATLILQCKIKQWGENVIKLRISGSMLDLSQTPHSFTCYVDSIHRLLKLSYNSGSETKKTRQASGIQMLSCSVEKLDLIWISRCSRNQTQEACPLSIPPYLCLQQRDSC